MSRETKSAFRLTPEDVERNLAMLRRVGRACLLAVDAAAESGDDLGLAARVEGLAQLARELMTTPRGMLADTFERRYDLLVRSRRPGDPEEPAVGPAHAARIRGVFSR